MKIIHGTSIFLKGYFQEQFYGLRKVVSLPKGRPF